MKRVVINKYIVADPEICHGKPTFKGTGVMVWQILEMLSAGETVKEIMENFPSLNRKHIQAALNYASSLTKLKLTPKGWEEFPLFEEVKI